MHLSKRAACSAALTIALGAASACGAADSATSFGLAPNTGASDAGSPLPGTGGATNGDAGPPEIKAEGDYQSPVATGQFVWIANPTSGRVAYIRATTLDVKTVEAGNGPSVMAAVPDPNDDVAIVINALSHDATLLRASGDALSSKTFPLAADVNAWAVSKDGRWAIAWADASKYPNADATQGFQDLSVLDLTSQAPPTIVAVGYRPVKIAFAADGGRAFAVTQDGISVVDLGGAVPLVIKNFAISDDPLDDPGTRDVSFTPDGAWALVRRDGQKTITVVSLKDGARTTVTLPANATDLALSPKGDRALVALRDAGAVAVLPIPQIVADPASLTVVSVPGQTVGRAIVTAPGSLALLFTTAFAENRITALALDATPSPRTIRLYSPLLAVFPTDDAANAIVLHQLPADAGTSAHGAFSVVPIGAELPAKIVGTTAPPNAVALSPASDRALVAVRDDASQTFGAYLVRMPSLEVDPYVLASPPIAAGVVAGANRGYVAQSHPEGRITFIDLGTGEARTLTGFELGARVVGGTLP